MLKVQLKSEAASAEVYLHGAHVTGFQLNGQPPLLFLSRASRFEPDRAIRGGIPVILPWFGPREGQASHGFARLMDWELADTGVSLGGATYARFRLPTPPEPWPPFQADYLVTVTDRLTAELILTNASPDQFLEFEECLHTYFHVGDISRVAVAGLGHTPYLDELDGVSKTEPGEAFLIQAEVDRTYFDTTDPVEIRDASLGRTIRVEKSGSHSTVVWNPWADKARKMADFGDDEYREMICVESGNIGQNRIRLGPAETSRLKICLSSQAR